MLNRRGLFLGAVRKLRARACTRLPQRELRHEANMIRCGIYDSMRDPDGELVVRRKFLHTERKAGKQCLRWKVS
jgi:hypothetical protein